MNHIATQKNSVMPIPGLGICEAEVGACNIANGSLPKSSLFGCNNFVEEMQF